MNHNGKLSKHFDEWEFVCHCCGKVRIDPDLIDALEKLRDLADAPVRIISGYRCPDHNDKCGGAKNSQHMLGKAADVTIKGKSVFEALKLVQRIPAFMNGGVGLYSRHGFVHCDVRNKRARWGGA